MIGPTGRIGSRQQLAGGVSWGCPGDVLGVPSGLVGTTYTNSGFMETPHFEKLTDISCVHVDPCGPMQFNSINEWDLVFCQVPLIVCSNVVFPRIS